MDNFLRLPSQGGQKWRYTSYYCCEVRIKAPEEACSTLKSTSSSSKHKISNLFLISIHFGIHLDAEPDHIFHFDADPNPDPVLGKVMDANL